jgi:chromosome segregation ATPase
MEDKLTADFFKGEIATKYPSLLTLNDEQVEGLIWMFREYEKTASISTEALKKELEESRRQVEELEWQKEKLNEVIESQKQTFDALLKKYNQLEQANKELTECLNEWIIDFEKHYPIVAKSGFEKKYETAKSLLKKGNTTNYSNDKK